jgi:predicted nucleic acid-binding protein
VKRVFIDTSAFFAHLVAEDVHHARARSLFELAFQESWSLVTTNAVVWETYTLIRKRARNSRSVSLGFLEAIEDGFCDLVRVEPGDESAAVDLLRSHGDKEYSFCDALSFVIMNRLGVEQAMAFDRDFSSHGRFPVL